MNQQDFQQLEKLLEKNSQTIRGEIRSTAGGVKKEIVGELTDFLDKTIIPQFDEVNNRIDSLRQEFKSELRNNTESLRQELKADISGLNHLMTNIEVSLTDKVVLHDQEIKTLKKRLTRVETKPGLVV